MILTYASYRLEIDIQIEWVCKILACGRQSIAVDDAR